MLLGVAEQILEFTIRTVRPDLHPYSDLLVAGRNGVVETKHAAQVEIAFELGRKLADRDPARHRMQNEGRRDASGKRVEKEFDRIGAFVVPQKDGRFSTGIRTRWRGNDRPGRRRRSHGSSSGSRRR
ncbi:MAG: hypothetical protein R3D52_12350 [Xanthobacteraceae bacterium]